MSDHQPDCRWQQTSPEECEYRETHHYCPHREHACTCDGVPASRCPEPNCDGDAGHDGRHFQWVPE